MVLQIILGYIKTSVLGNRYSGIKVCSVTELLHEPGILLELGKQS